MTGKGPGGHRAVADHAGQRTIFKTPALGKCVELAAADDSHLKSDDIGRVQGDVDIG